jgi:Zn-dependent peptidase ImmA (M78 family)
MAFIRGIEKRRKDLIDQGYHTPEELIDFAKKNNCSVDPIDVVKLTDLLGIVIRYEPMDGDDSGSLSCGKKSGKWIMKVNSLHHFNRQRFTIAHELAHFICHRHLNDFFSDTVFFRNGEQNRLEVEANQFAARLLMPEKYFRRYIKESSNVVSDISEHFGVSSMAVRIRAKQLNYSGHNV